MASSRRSWVRGTPRARSGRRWRGTRSRSSSPATGCSPRARSRAGSRPSVAGKRRRLSSRAKACSSNIGRMPRSKAQERRELSLFQGKGGLAFDSGVALAKLRDADPPLGRMIERIGPFRLERHELHSPFESLLEAIVYQQLTGKAAATILGRVKALFPGKRFPSPDDVLGSTDEKLRGAGLSRAKVLAIKDLSAKANEGVVPGLAELGRLEDAAIVERLTEIR